MKRTLFFLISVFLLQSTAFAQTNNAKNKDEKCVSISVTLTPTLLEIGEIAEAVVEIGKNKYELEFKWNIADGEIVEGQGTKKVKVRKRTQDAGGALTITVEVQGLPKTCANTASATEQVARHDRHYIPKLKSEDLLERLAEY